MAGAARLSDWNHAAASFWAARSNMVARRPERVTRWLEAAAEHPRTFYGLIARRTPKHGQVACQTCHTQGVSVKPDGCIDCHGDQHNGLTQCVDCHTIKNWNPTGFSHPQQGPHVPAGDEPLPCDACHQGGFGQKPGCPCHGGNPPSGD